jgi:hypothetical protein
MMGFLKNGGRELENRVNITPGDVLISEEESFPIYGCITGQGWPEKSHFKYP